MATAALVCGIAGIVLFFLLVPSVVAVVLGFVAASKAKAAAAAGGVAEGRARARAGWILGIVGLVLFAGLIVGGGIAGWYDEDRSINDLEVGDCVELDFDADELSTVPVVSCTEPHHAEVFVVADLFDEDDEFPGREAMRRRIDEQCGAEAFEDYVGTPYAESSLERSFAAPSPDSWDAGDRTVVCFVIRPDGTTVDRPLRDSGL
jgi:hypothetical protein